MKLTGILLAAVLFSTGCATKKFVVRTVSPVQQRVEAAEAKNTEQDTKINSVNTDLSATKEKLTATDAKATQAGEAAKAADQKAGNAQQSADAAKQSADAVRTFAEERLNKVDQSLQAMNKFTMVKSESVLFGFNQDTLSDEAKGQLEAIGSQAKGLSRFVVEVQGFTDQSGPATYNEALSGRRAQAVARHLVHQFQIPIRHISTLGSGYVQVEGEDTSREGRKMARRVEVRLWVAEGEGKMVPNAPVTTTSLGQ